MCLCFFKGLELSPVPRFNWSFWKITKSLKGRTSTSASCKPIFQDGRTKWAAGLHEMNNNPLVVPNCNNPQKQFSQSHLHSISIFYFFFIRHFKFSLISSCWSCLILDCKNQSTVSAQTGVLGIHRSLSSALIAPLVRYQPRTSPASPLSLTPQPCIGHLLILHHARLNQPSLRFSHMSISQISCRSWVSVNKPVGFCKSCLFSLGSWIILRLTS